MSSLPGTLNFRMKFCHSTGIARSGGGVRVRHNQLCLVRALIPQVTQSNIRTKFIKKVSTGTVSGHRGNTVSTATASGHQGNTVSTATVSGHRVTPCPQLLLVVTG